MRLLLALLLSSLASLAHADEEAMDRFKYLMGDALRREQAYAAGQERALFCSFCHGETGNSKRPHIPNLAAQNPVYLFDSFEKFANGERSDYVMSNLAKSLTLEDRVNIAVYFSQQNVLAPEPPKNSALSEEGRVIYQRTCATCHGDHAQGRETMPRLAGQPLNYLHKALTRFRNNDSSRTGSVMIGIASKLSDTEIDAVVAYLSQLALTAQQEQRASAQLVGAAIR